MSFAGKPDQFRLGFLTVIEVPEKGYVGGLLVTTHQGRPLEFQCTLPVKPNSTQEILYGPTLTGFLLGELIGGALVDKAGIKPHLVLTDRASVLDVRNQIDAPVALVSADASPDRTAENRAPNSPGDAGASQSEIEEGRTVRIGKQTLRFHSAHSADGDVIEKEAKRFPNDADFSEPFNRVREALQETLRIGTVR